MNIDCTMIGARIKEVRRKKGMTQERLAEKLDVSIGYVSQIERGITKISLDLLGAVSEILETDPSFFISGTVFASDDYKSSEIMSGYEKLCVRDKLLVNSLIQSMLKN